MRVEKKRKGGSEMERRKREERKREGEGESLKKKENRRDEGSFFSVFMLPQRTLGLT